MDNGNKGGYFFVDTGSLGDSTLTSITKVAVYGSLNSAVALPVYGNVALQALLHRATGDDSIDLNFTLGPQVPGVPAAATVGSTLYMTTMVVVFYTLVPLI